MSADPQKLTLNKSDRDILERRLDSLGWVLEGNSMCAAVAIIDSTLYISANDFSTSTVGTQHLAQVEEIMNYFKRIANGDIKDEERKAKRNELMISICRSQISVASLGRIAIPEEIIEKVVNTDILEKDTPMLSEEKAIIKFFKKHVADVFIAFGYGKKLYKEFIKIEQSIERKGTEKSFDKTQIEAFKHFKHKQSKKGKSKRFESNILFLSKDDGKDVHAEAQILDQIVEVLENGKGIDQKEIYIGISKKCCKNCHVLLKVAQKELQKSGITLKFGGAHDQSFDSNWGQPPFFNKVREQSQGTITRSTTKKKAAEVKEEEQPIGERIKRKYLKAIAEKINEEVEGRYAIRHSPSSSDVSIDAGQKVEDYKDYLLSKYQVLESFGFKETRSASILNSIIKLCDLDVIQNVFEQNPRIRNQQDTVIIELMEGAEELGLDVSEEELTKFLKNPNLAGKELSNYFNGIEEPTSSQQLDIFEAEDKDNAFSEENTERQIQDDYRLAWQLQAEEYAKNKHNDAFSPEDFEDSSSPKRIKTYSMGNQIFALRHVIGDGDCFFHAVNHPELNRDNLINRLLQHANDDDVRQVFALEIRQFLYLGYSGFHESDTEAQACQLLLGKQNSKIRKMFLELNAVEKNVSKEVINVRHEIGIEETRDKSPEELLEMLNDKLQSLMDVTEEEIDQTSQLKKTRYQELIENLGRAIQERSDLNESITAYCEEEGVFRNYVNTYLNVAEGYIPFSRKLFGEEVKTTIDVINQIFNSNIQVHLLESSNSDNLIQITENMPENGEPINIFYNGFNHFEGLQLYHPETEEEFNLDFNEEGVEVEKSIPLEKTKQPISETTQTTSFLQSQSSLIKKRKDTDSRSGEQELLPMYKEKNKKSKAAIEPESEKQKMRYK